MYFSNKIVKSFKFETFIIISELFLIKKMLKLKSGSSKGSKEIVGKLSQAQLREIAEIKLVDLNCYTVEEAMKIVAGTAKNMGVEVEEN